MTRTTLMIVGLFAVLAMLATPAALAHPVDQAAPAEDQEAQANLAGFVPPVVVLEDGDRVSWTALDVAHTFTEGTTSAVPSPCVDVAFSTVNTQGATFTLTDGQLQADEDITDDEEPVTCQSATVEEDKAAMGFYCRFHPWMNGVLVVYDGSATSQAAVLNDPGLLLQRDALAASTL